MKFFIVTIVTTMAEGVGLGIATQQLHLSASFSANFCCKDTDFYRYRQEKGDFFPLFFFVSVIILIFVAGLRPKLKVGI